MSNLPPGVSIGDRDAPWNQDHPEPDFECPGCENYYSGRSVGPDLFCPNCGEGLEEY